MTLFIPPQLALFAAKHWKKLVLGLVLAAVVAGIWFAVRMHERTVEQLAQSEAARAAGELAHKTTQASLEVSREAQERWRASAEKYQETLTAQRELTAKAREEERRLDERLRELNLDAETRADPADMERRLNRATARVIRLLNCHSTLAGCGDGDRGAAGPDSGDSSAGSPPAGTVRMDSVRARVLAGSGGGVLLPGSVPVRDPRA